MAGFDIARDMRGQWLAFWSDPINDWTFHSLGVIGPGTISTLLNLPMTYKPMLNTNKSSEDNRPNLLSPLPLLLKMTWADFPSQAPIEAAREKQNTPSAAYELNQKLLRWWQYATYAIVRLSSSGSSYINWRLFAISICTLQNTWTVLPKWRPWCTKGSWEVLQM